MIRRRSRAWMTATLGVTAMVLMAGCGSNSPSSSAAGSSSSNSGQFSKKSPLTIGYSIQSAQDPYWQGYVHGIQHGMKGDGFARVVNEDNPGSAEKKAL